MPAGAAQINIENDLHLIPSTLVQDRQRPWYLYDSVHPAPLYRQMGDDYDWNQHINSPDVSEGDESDDLSDTPGVEKKPVTVRGYA